MDPLLPDAEKVAALRDALPATGAGIYLDTATAGPLPAETAAAMSEADDWDLRVGRAREDREDDVAQRADEARAVLAALVGAQAREVALCPGIDSALAVAAHSAGLRPGDCVLVTSLDGPAVHAAAIGLRNGLGAKVDVARVDPADGPDEIAAAVRGAMTDRTRMVISGHVYGGTGTGVPVAAVADAVRATGAWLIVDASQSAGAIPVDVTALGGDFVAFATDRWALGPEGTAALWTGRRAIAEGRPSYAGASAYETLTTAGTAVPWPDARRFEPAILPRRTLLGLARSVGWLEMYVGLQWAFERTARLIAFLRAELAATPGVEVVTQAPAAGIVTFRIGAWGADEAATELGRRVFAILRPLPELEALRASVAWFNTEDELARFTGAVREIAAHTPQTLPRRPSLVILPADGGSAS